MAVISFQLNNKHSRLFSKNKSDFSRYVVAFCLSVLLICADAHYRCADPIRRAFSLFISPIQYVSDYPVYAFNWIRNLLLTQHTLIQENRVLQEEQLHLKSQLQKLTAISRENEELKELLSLSDLLSRRTTGARVLSINTSNTRQLLILNKGRRDQIFRGQPVLDQYGVLGQVIDVGHLTSTVLLISDSMSAVPVRNNRTGETGILVGNNKTSQLSLMHLPKTSSIAKGDLLMTSGLGQRYPEGYPVGKVVDISSVPGEEFIKVHVKPVALLEKARLVLLVWPNENEAMFSNQIKERLHALERYV